MRKKLIAIILMGSMLFSTTTVFAEPAGEEAWKAKVDQAALDDISNGLDEIEVYVFLNDLQHEEVVDKLTEAGIDETLYTDEDKFEQELVPEITRSVIAEYGAEAAYEPVLDEEENYPFILRNSDKKVEETLIDKTIAQEVDEYKQEKREIVKELCEESNASFIEENEIDEQDIIYNSMYSKTLIVKATPEEIQKYAALEEVDSICKYEQIEQTCSTDIIMDQINASRVSGTKSNGYTGSGIKIGIIEAGNGRYNESNPHLKGNSKIECLNKDKAQISSHATNVTTIIAGKNVTVGNQSFEGVAPDATVYQIGISTNLDVYAAIETLINKNVDVINFSAGSSSTGYSSYDCEIDRLVRENDVVFVKSAGNEGSGSGYISSPGYAYNIITVGNLETVTSAGGRIYGSYSVRNTSSYKEPSYLTNKPDIAAPGSNFYFASDAGAFGNRGSGTSYAAPLVTGVIAQMMQAHSFLKANPVVAKAWLLATASTSSISATDNAYKSSSLLRDKTGAGMLDAEDAVYLATGYLPASFGYKQLTSLNPGTITAVATPRFYETNKVRIAMVYDKPDNNIITSTTDIDDIDIYLKDSSGKIVAQSVSSNNNVEIIEYVVEKTGNYTIEVKRFARSGSNTGTPKVGIVWEY